MLNLPNMRAYWCRGPVRGACGHHHKTLEAADRCLQRDIRGCAKQGGYSDRRIVPVGTVEGLSDVEAAYLDGVRCGK